MMAEVVLISTGGTISCRPGLDSRLLPGASTDLVERVARSSSVRLRHHEQSSVFGTALGITDLFAIASRARKLLQQPDVAGAVVTAGTGIIEEGAYLCELLNDTGKPIVWTGAQRSADERDFDGERNLSDSVRVAASLEARTERCGAASLVCFNEEVLPARDAVKQHKSSVAAFSAGDGGILARTSGNRLGWVRRAIPGRQFEVGGLVAEVDLISLAAGSDDRFVRASLAAGARGIVVEGFPGVGMVCPGVVDSLHEAVRSGVVVVLSSRSPLGTMIGRYGGALGGGTLEQQGVILGGDVAPVKLRIGLMVLLALPRQGAMAALAAELWQ